MRLATLPKASVAALSKEESALKQRTGCTLSQIFSGLHTVARSSGQQTTCTFDDFHVERDEFYGYVTNTSDGSSVSIHEGR